MAQSKYFDILQLLHRPCNNKATQISDPSMWPVPLPLSLSLLREGISNLQTNYETFTTKYLHIFWND